MGRLQLSELLVTAQDDDNVREITIGNLLREVAGKYGRYLIGTRDLRRKILDDIGATKLDDMHKLV